MEALEKEMSERDKHNVIQGLLNEAKLEVSTAVLSFVNTGAECNISKRTCPERPRNGGVFRLNSTHCIRAFSKVPQNVRLQFYDIWLGNAHFFCDSLS